MNVRNVWMSDDRSGLMFPREAANWDESPVELETNLRDTRSLTFHNHREGVFTLNSLLPLGRYIDMDPSTTELVISQTQFIRFGQFLLG